MADTDVFDLNTVRTKLLKELMEEVEWSSTANVEDASFLYATDAESTPNDESGSAHFGLNENGGVTILTVVNDAGKALLGENMIDGLYRTLHRDIKYRRKFGGLVFTTKNNLNSLTSKAVWRIVKKALLDTLPGHDTLKQGSAPAWVGDVKFNGFMDRLKRSLRAKLANDSISINELVRTEIRGVGTNYGIHDLVLGKVVKPTVADAE